ncbi:DUF5682 family protein [Nocardioides sp. 616]|uniref:DUF5682 family protein n=1 Tax=Nocardioides sp. 616 TaxID=2268090 RepID=UPI000CE3B8C4|nr:DUF5682 family protein [Nocardioides sp. 616]
MATASVDVLGVRHHGPGSARSVAQALEELTPDLVLIEGCPELDGVVELLGDAAMVPPVAGLVYAAETPKQAMFYPLAEFSPEWVAARWALDRGIPVRFLDLPASHQFGLAAQQDEDEEVTERAPRPDPLATLAAAAGYDDAERWWEDAVEQRHETAPERFDAVREAMAEVRVLDERPADDPDVLENARREAYMRKILRAELKALDPQQRIAVVCGAWHAPALVPGTFPPVSRDNDLLRNLPKVKVAATWTPWTSARLSYDSGYGAGVDAPGWYAHLFAHWSRPDLARADVATTWLVRVARALRGEQLDASTASVVESVRLATALAAVRGRPSVGLSELDDAAQTVLCDGSRLPLDLVHRTLVVGEELGRVPDSAPTVPLAADLARQQRSLRLKPGAALTTVELDLRKAPHLARSVFLHRLAVLGIGWATPADTGRTTGTFKEAWQLEWRPEIAVDVVEASIHGTTVEAAAVSRVAERAAASDDLAELSDLVGACLLADLPDGVRAVLAVLADRAAVQHDVPALLVTVEPLARTCRYGDVRGADVTQVRGILSATVLRACLGLAMACAALDDDAASLLRARIDSAHRGLALLQNEELDQAWRQGLESISDVDSVHGSVAGRATRLLLDAGQLDAEEAARRMSRRLSLAAPAVQGAAWLDGFLAGDAVLLVHDLDLLGLVDAWVSGVEEEVFEDLLPLLRRTFSAFSAPERRTIGGRVSRLDGTGSPEVTTDLGIDLEQATPALLTVARLLGWGVRT